MTVREEYLAALKEGQKEYAKLTDLGKDPGPAVLEELLPESFGPENLSED